MFCKKMALLHGQFAQNKFFLSLQMKIKSILFFAFMTTLLLSCQDDNRFMSSVPDYTENQKILLTVHGYN